jgi:diphthine synthase
MLEKYVPKAKKALGGVREKIGARDSPRYGPLLTNVEAYIQDSESFRNEGRYELAVLSVVYAEGLLDALGFLGELEIEW